MSEDQKEVVVQAYRDALQDVDDVLKRWQSLRCDSGAKPEAVVAADKALANARAKAMALWDATPDGIRARAAEEAAWTTPEMKAVEQAAREKNLAEAFMPPYSHPDPNIWNQFTEEQRERYLNYVKERQEKCDAAWVVLKAAWRLVFNTKQWQEWVEVDSKRSSLGWGPAWWQRPEYHPWLIKKVSR